MTIKGADLSHWNTVVNYEQMVDAGVRFCCPKLGQGRLAKDAMYETHKTNLNRLHVPWDFYFYCDYRYSGADNVHNLIAKAGGDYGCRHPVMDLEFNDAFGPRPDGVHLRTFTLDFFGELEALTGLLATLYSNRDIIKQMTYQISQADLAKLLRHQLWMATDAPYGNPAPFPKYIMNQYDMDTIVSWSNSTIDWDDFNGPEEEFEAWYKIGTIPPPPPPVLDKLTIIWREITGHFPNWNYDN